MEFPLRFGKDAFGSGGELFGIVQDEFEATDLGAVPAVDGLYGTQIAHGIVFVELRDVAFEDAGDGEIPQDGSSGIPDEIHFHPFSAREAERVGGVLGDQQAVRGFSLSETGHFSAFDKSGKAREVVIGTEAFQYYAFKFMVGFQDAGALGEGLYVFDLGYGGEVGVKILVQGYRLGGSVASLLEGGELDVSGEGGDVAADLALEPYSGR